MLLFVSTVSLSVRFVRKRSGASSSRGGEFASELTNCLSVDEFASELTNCLCVDEFATELTLCQCVCLSTFTDMLLGVGSCVEPAATGEDDDVAQLRRKWYSPIIADITPRRNILPNGGQAIGITKDFYAIVHRPAV